MHLIEYFFILIFSLYFFVCLSHFYLYLYSINMFLYRYFYTDIFININMKSEEDNIAVNEYLKLHQVLKNLYVIKNQSKSKRNTRSRLKVNEMAFDTVGYLNCSWRICQSNGQSCITLWIIRRDRFIFQWKSPVNSCVRDQWFSLEQSLWYIIVCLLWSIASILQSVRSHCWHSFKNMYFDQLIT